MFKRKAEELRAKHKKDHPQYKYQPRRKKSKVSAAASSSSSSVSSIAHKPVRSTASKKATKLKEYSRLSESSASPNNSGNELYIDESVSPVSDQGVYQSKYRVFLSSISISVRQNYSPRITVLWDLHLDLFYFRFVLFTVCFFLGLKKILVFFRHQQIKRKFHPILFMFYIAPSLQPNFGYQLPDNMPFDYHCNAYGNNNSTNHNHNNSIHVNNTVATGIGKPFFPLRFRRIHEQHGREKKFSILLQFLCCSEVEKHLMLEMSFFSSSSFFLLFPCIS